MGAGIFLSFTIHTKSLSILPKQNSIQITIAVVNYYIAVANYYRRSDLLPVVFLVPQGALGNT